MVAGAIPGRRTAWAILVAHGGYRGRDYQAEVAEQVVEVLRVVWGWETDAEPVSAQAVPAPTTTKTLDYTYDNLNRLVGVSLNQTPTETYVLDPTGNLTSLTVAGITTNFTYNALNQPNAPGSSLFDPKGQTSTDSQGRTFEWDAEGRVTAIVRGNQRSEFGYDGLSRRTRITELVDGVVV